MVYFKVKVRAGAKVDRLISKGAETFEIHVREPAEHGRANTAALQLLAQELRTPVGRLWIIKGAHSPSKIIAIR